MDLIENSIKDPLDFAANLAMAITENTLKEHSHALEVKKRNYMAKLDRYTQLKTEGKTDPNFSFDPNYCEECGDDLPIERQVMYEVLCTSCKSAQEVKEKRRRG